MASRLRSCIDTLRHFSYNKAMADIAKGVRSFTIGTAVSRILGMVRESVIAALYGAGLSTDAYYVAFRIPNLLRDLFAETALSAAFIPVLADEKNKSKNAQNLLASNVFNALFLIVGLITIAGIFASPLLVRFFAFGFGTIPGKMDLTTQLTAIMFPFLLFISFAAWAMSYLNSEGAFFVPSVAPAFFNLFSILLPLISYGWLVHRHLNPIYALAVGVLLGGLFQFLIQLPRLYQKGFRYTLYLNFRDPNLIKMLGLFLPVAIGISGVFINTTINTVLTTFLEEKSVTWLMLAFRITNLPMGLFGEAVGAVALATLARQVAGGQKNEIRDTLFDSLKLVFFLTISTSVIIAFLAHPICRIIYEHGKFTAFDTWATSQALILYVLGIPFTAGIRNLAAVYYAHKDAKIPMWSSLLGIGINIGLSVILMRVIGYRAFPLAITIAALANITFLLTRVHRKIGTYDIKPLLHYCVLLAVASAAAGLCGWLLNTYLARVSTAFYFQVINLLGSGSAACIVFYILCRIMGLKEVDDYLRRLLKK